MNVVISVVIPTFKRPELLKKCLLALQQQQFNSEYEVIVVSDGKDDATEALRNECKPLPGGNYIYTSLPKKGGPAAARNWGWRMAAGELIAFTDDDTEPSATWLQSYWDAYLQHNKQEIAFSGSITVPISQQPTDYERNTGGLETADFVTANCAATKSALEKIQGFDEDFAMAWREDSELEFRFLNQQIPIVKVPSALVLHPVRKANWGVSLKEQKKNMYNALLYKKHPHLFRKKIMASPLWNYYAIILSFFGSLVLVFLQFHLLALVTGSCWLFLVSVFIMKRLKGSSHSFSHVSEMIVTSILIPFVSVYWTLYGAYKFKVFFL